MLRDALELDGPAVLRFPNGAARHVHPDDVGSGLRARQLVVGADADVCIMAVGRLVEGALHAAAELAARDVSATVWDVRVCKPLDPEMIADAARHRLVVTAEDGVRVGGVGSSIADALAGAAESRTSPPVLVLGTPDAYIPQGRVAMILSELGLDGPGIAAAAATALRAGSLRL